MVDFDRVAALVNLTCTHTHIHTLASSKNMKMHDKKGRNNISTASARARTNELSVCVYDCV